MKLGKMKLGEWCGEEGFFASAVQASRNERRPGSLESAGKPLGGDGEKPNANPAENWKEAAEPFSGKIGKFSGKRSDAGPSGEGGMSV
jgi:hypothetical protein